MSEKEAPKKFTLMEQVTCVRREIEMRRRVYPRFVISGKMKQEQADYQIDCMSSVLDALNAMKP